MGRHVLLFISYDRMISIYLAMNLYNYLKSDPTPYTNTNTNQPQPPPNTPQPDPPTQQAHSTFQN